MGNEVYLIYCLINPIDNTIFYVGRTTSSLDLRLSRHIGSMKVNENKDKCAILTEIISKGLRPIIKLIEQTTCMQRELEIINEYSLIHPLVNIVKRGYKQPGSGRKPSGIIWTTVSFRIDPDWEDTVKIAVRNEIARLKTLQL